MYNFFKKWTKKEDGSTAIEFALIAIPFVFMLIGIIELSLYFATTSLIHGAAETAARLIRTGQVQQSLGDPQQMFEDALCEHAATFVNCNDIQYEVITLANFGDFENYPPQYDDDGNLITSGFSAGGVNDVVLIRAVHRYNFATPLLAPVLGENGGNSRLILSTIILQTEPYDFDEDEGA
ncbi:MAG: TadE/TadG family type IV pilus assembly protein [Bdellovibrionales bacterium]